VTWIAKFFAETRGTWRPNYIYSWI